MRGKKTRWEGDRTRAERLALDCGVPTLAGALCGRLALDRREEDSVQLARLFTEVGLAADAACDIDVDATVLIAHREGATALAAGLVLRLLAEGRVTDASRLVALFKATNIGSGDYDSLVPSA